MKHSAFILLLVATAIVLPTASSGRRDTLVPHRPTRVSGPPARAQTLTLLYTSSARGQIRSCNCSKFRFGGYGRQLFLLKSIRASCPNSILLEGGDATEWGSFQSELKSDVTAKAFKLLGYQAMVPGEQELGGPGTRRVSRLSSKSMPVVCANYHGAKGACVPYVVLKTKAGMRVGVIGLLSQSVVSFTEQELRGAVTDPLEALRPLVGRVRAKSDVVVVVYHGPAGEAGKVGAVRGVDLVLSTHRSSSELMFPDKTKATNEVIAPVNAHSGATLVNAETNANWSLGRIDIELNRDSKIKNATHKLLYLDRRYSEAPEMVKVYDAYNEKVKQAVLTTSAKLKREGEAMLVSRGMNLAQMRARLHKSPFATAEKCKECHARIYESWASSRHARAMATLEKTHQEFDPECVGCHATGVLVRNGYVNMKETPELANVQCEACHGPGLAHAGSPSKGFGQAGEQSCRSCHTDERTPDFDFEKAWEKIRH